MSSNSDKLWAEVADLLHRRPGWTVQAMSTPGLSPYWSFASGSRTEFSILVLDASIHVGTGTEEQVEFAQVGDLVEWLTANRPGSLQDPGGGFLAKLRSRKLFKWE